MVPLVGPSATHYFQIEKKNEGPGMLLAILHPYISKRGTIGLFVIHPISAVIASFQVGNHEFLQLA